MSNEDLRKKYGLGSKTNDQIRQKYGLGNTPRTIAEREQQEFFNSVGNEVQTYATDWQNFWKNGGSIGTSDYSNLTISGAKLDQRLKDLQKEYAGNEQATNYFSQLSDALTGMRNQEYDLHKANNYKKLFSEFQGVAQTLDDYSKKLQNDEWLSEADRKAYSDAFSVYANVGDRLISKEFGYSDIDINNFNTSKAEIGSQIGNVRKYYEEIGSEYNQGVSYHNHQVARSEAQNYDEEEAQAALDQLLREATAKNQATSQLKSLENHLVMGDNGEIDWEKTAQTGAFVTMGPNGAYVETDPYIVKQTYYNLLKYAGADGKYSEEYERAKEDHEYMLWAKKDYQYLDLIDKDDFSEIVSAEKEKDPDIDGRRTNELYGYEKDIYYYIRGTEGQEAADDYIEHMTSYLKERRGWDTARWIDSRYFKGTAATIYGLATGAAGGARAIGELFTDLDPAVFDYANTELQEGSYLSDTQKKFHQGAMVIGQQIPAMVGTAVTGNPLVGRMISTATAYGLAEQQGRAMGMTSSQAKEYALLNAAGEMALSAVSDKLFGVAGLDDAGKLGSKIDNMKSAWGRAISKVGLRIVGEELEEIPQEYLEPLFVSLITGNEYKAPEWEDVLETAIMTFFTTGVMSVPGISIREGVKQNSYRNIGKTIKEGGTLSDLKAQALNADKATQRFSVLNVDDEGVGKGQDVLIGQLYSRLANAENANNATNNRVDISHRLQKIGVSAQEANEIASAVVAQQIGEELTSQQRKTIRKIKNNSDVADIVYDVLALGKGTAGQNTIATDVYRNAASNIAATNFLNSMAETAEKKNIADELQKNGIVIDRAKEIADALYAQQNGTATKKQAKLLKSLESNEAVQKAAASVKENADGKLTVSEYKAMLEQIVSEPENAENEAVSDGVDEEPSVSVDGKTFVESTGKVADSVSFQSIGADGVTLNVDGTDTKMDDVSFGSEKDYADAKRISEIEAMTPAVANEIWNNPDREKERFVTEAVRAFRAGVRNDNRVLERLDSNVISKKDAESLFKKGREVATGKANAENAEVKAKDTGKTGKKTGGVYYGYEGKIIDQREGKLTRKQKVAVEFAKRMARKFGANYYFYESYEDKNGNLVFKDKDGNVRSAEKGFYDPSDGSIHVSLSAENTLFVISHELVHFIRDWSPVRFKQMADLVMEGFNRQNISAEELVLLKQNEYAKNGIELTEEQAFEEVIAAALEDVIAGDRVQEFMMEAEGINKSLGAKIKKFFQDICDLFKEILDVYKNVRSDSPEASVIHKMEDIYQKLQRALVRGVYEAGTNFQKAENTTMEGGVRYKNGEYWHPDMTRAEITDVRSIAKSEVFKTNNYLGIDAKWLYNKEKGNEYFALYSTIDSKEPTILYACKDDIAALHNSVLIKELQREENNNERFNTGTGLVDGLLNSLGNVIGRKSQHPGSVMGTRSNNGNASIHSRNKRIRLDKAFINCLRNIEKIQQQYGVEDWYQFAADIGDYKKAKQISNDAAKKAGFEYRIFHGTPSKFNSFNTDVIYVSANKNHAKEYGNNILDLYMKADKPYITEDGVIRDDNGDPFMLDGEEVTVGWLDAAPDAIEYLISKGHDAAWDKDMDYVAVLNAENLKSADPVTYDDDGNVIPLSERFNEKSSDLRYSVGAKTDKAVQKMLETENQKLQEDVAKLKELLKLQSVESGGTKFLETSVLAAARYLKKNSGTSGNTKELAKMLNDFYEYIATSKDLTWEDIREQAQPIANWIMDNVEHGTNEYFQEILDQMHGAEFRLTDEQMTEAVNAYGSYNDFRRALAGAVKVSKNSTGNLEAWWQEMSTLYPDMFGADVKAADMPVALADVVNRLKNDNTSALEYAYNRRWIEQDLIRDIYDSYWRVSNLRTVADRYAAQRNKLISEHHKRINNLKADNREKMDQLREQHRAEVEMIRKAYEQKSEKERKQLAEKYKESRAKDVESRNKTEMRKKIRKAIRDLDKILNRGDKKRNVKEGMKGFVAEALASAEVLFTDNYTNDDIVRNGFGVELSEAETKYLEEVRKYMDELANLPAGSYEAMQARMEAEEQLKNKIAYRMSKLKDAFFRERQRINRTEVAEVLGKLADAYAKLESSEYAYVNGAYQDNVHQYLKWLQDEVGGAKVKDMTLSQLESLHKAYTMVLTTVQMANKLFTSDIKMSKEEAANRVMMEVYEAGGEHGLWTKGQLSRNQYSWNNTKPIYAAERTGSKTFVQLVNGLFKGQYNWAVDMAEAKDFRLQVAKKYGFKNWDMEKTYKFTSSSGIEFELNLNQIMALYAYAKREQAHDHLLKGGFVFGKNTEVVVTKNGIKRTYLNKSAKAHNISDEIMGEIVSNLTDEQKGFVDEMQDYLSTTMGNKGNEVSMRLYGVKLFMEKFYFPLRSAGQFKEKAKEAEMKQQQGQISIANSGFTHSTTPKASNPVVLDGFTDVWASHVNEMSLYHSMVLPMEDFRRVYNYASPNMEGQESASVNSFIENAYGDAATGYFDQLYKELNGGAIVDPRENGLKKAIGKFKKGAVILSNSVWVQQFSAIGRATAEIDLKYFVGAKVDKQKHAILWDEVKKYAPVAIIKEMGGFDTHTGLSAKDYLLAEEYGKGERTKAFRTDKQYRSDVTGYLPQKADELTWCAIWEAVKRETQANNPKMDVKSEEFLKKAGDRFSEVIEKTQVYDSVLARSANMRSKNALMHIITAFMAEPTTTINMIENALRKGNKKFIARTFGAVAASIIINNALASIIYAMRDDDEDETFMEKYTQAFTSGMLDDINPATYYPILKDIWSLFQGYDIERSDMAIYSDVVDALKRTVVTLAKYDSEMDEDETAEYYSQLGSALMSLLDAGAAWLGVPLKNVRRDLYSYYNTYKTVTGDQETTWSSFVDAVKGSAKDSAPVVGWLPGDSKTDKIYDAIISGDKVYEERFKSSYVDKNGNFDQTKYDTAVRKALRENDPRIKEAAEARIDGNFARYKELVQEIQAEDNFGFEIIRDAVLAEEKAILKKRGLVEDTEDSAEEDSYSTTFKVSDFYRAVADGDQKEIDMIYQDILSDKLADNYLEHEAKDAIASAFATEVGKHYMDGEITRDQAVKMLNDHTDKGESDVKKWDFEKEYGFPWSSRVRKYRGGKISERDLMQWVMDIEGEDRAGAQAYIDFLDLEKANPTVDITASDAESYFMHAEPAGIDIETYLGFKGKVSTIKGDDKKEQVLRYIHSLPLTVAQKDALYYAQGYVESKIKNAPWH